MPRCYPSILFNDFYGSAGDITVYHQNDNASLHLRALDAWRSIDWDTQKEWDRMAKNVESHRPPYDHKAFISGNNLFVSAHHGFAQLGNEHIPEPQPFQRFPDFWVKDVFAVSVEGNDLVLQLNCSLPACNMPSRYRLLTRAYLAALGKGMKTGRLRNFLSERAFRIQEDVVPLRLYDYLNVAVDDLSAYRLHLKYILLDEHTGYRCLWKRISKDIFL